MSLIFSLYPLLVVFLPNKSLYLSQLVFLSVELFCMKLVTWSQIKQKYFFICVYGIMGCHYGFCFGETFFQKEGL